MSHIHGLQSMVAHFLASPQGQQMIRDYLSSPEGQAAIDSFLAPPHGQQMAVLLLGKALDGLDIPQVSWSCKEACNRKPASPIYSQPPSERYGQM